MQLGDRDNALGIFPLVVAGGAGSASRRSLGTAVFGGMVAATSLTILFVPMFYVVIERLSERRGRTRASRLAQPAPAPPADGSSG